MPTIGALTTFVANTRAKAAEVNANFSAIRTTVNTYGAFVDVNATISAVWTFSTAPVLSGGLTVSSGGLTVTGNSTIAGTLGGLTGLTMTGNGAITGALSVSGTLTAAALAGAYTVPMSKLTAGENATAGTYGIGIRNLDTTIFRLHATTTIGDDQSSINKTLRLGSVVAPSMTGPGPGYDFQPWTYTNWNFLLQSSYAGGLIANVPSAFGAPLEPSGNVIGDGYFTSIFVKQDATGGRVWSLGGPVDWPNGGSQPTWSTAANAEAHIFMYLREDRWKVLAYHV